MGVIVCIPAYNEQDNIARVLDEIKNNLSSQDYKILVLDDGSTDRTAEIARSKGAIVVSHKRNLGLAQTFRDEMKESLARNATVIVHTDADGQYPSKFIPQMLSELEKGSDLVLGSRFRRGRYVGSLGKKVGNILFAKALSSMLKTEINDTTTGFRAFTPEVAKLPIINSFTYTQEQIIRAAKLGLRITEIPITTNKTRKSKLFRNSFDYAIKAWINIFRIYRDYEPLKFFGKIGISILTFGLAIALYFVYLHLTSGIHGHLGLLFLMLILLSTGLQIVLFGFLAEMMKNRD